LKRQPRRFPRARPWLAAGLLGGAVLVSGASRADDEAPPLVVTIAAPRDITQWTAAGSGSRIEAADIARTRPTHASELFARVPDVWISRGDGQESLIAIRSPVLTGPGAWKTASPSARPVSAT
jgi:outer membrane cobalamin receptor